MSTPIAQQKIIRLLLLTSWLCLLLWLMSVCSYYGFGKSGMARSFRDFGRLMPFVCFVVSLVGGLKADKKLQDSFGLPLFICLFICLGELMWLCGKLPEELRWIPGLTYCVGFVTGGVVYLFSKEGKRDIRKRCWMLVSLYGISTAMFFAIASWAVGVMIASVIWFFI